MKLRRVYTIGQKIKNFEYLGEATPKKDKNNNLIRMIKVKCFCGSVFYPRHGDVNQDKTKSCGCTKSEVIRMTHTVHGYSKDGKQTPLYSVWKAMKARCLNSKNKSYSDYGGRGISICSEWINNPKTFIDWALSNGYSQGLEIDRINNDGNYESSNCRWVNKNINTSNQRVIKKNNTTGYKGVRRTRNSNIFYATIGVENKRIYLGRFSSMLEAARAYDEYVLSHNLSHTINGV